MKLRRAMAAAAATAVIAPVALLAAPAAYATDETTPTPSTSVSESATESSSPSPSASESTPETTPTPSASASESAPQTSTSPSASASESSPAPTESEPEESESPDPEPSICKDTTVDVGISGLPGKISAGSGWHKFSLNVLNNSDSTLNDLDFYAGASADKAGTNLFSSKQVQLQAWDPDDKIWVDLNEDGLAVGYVGYTDELKPDYEVNIPLRLNVSKSAPVGAGFSLGATIYSDDDAECVGVGEVSYKFQIVSAGTDTGGTKPQEGGKAPVTDKKPSGTTPQVTGSLAETGSSSALPMISLVGGAAVVAGAGAIFVVRRRKAGAQA
ncbi:MULTISPECIES: LAETG motif-containing sortase-dependent surface protein [Streptomyces]|uniref:LPXTG cell wall anchor domain-containing protein n=1 Tax=Streptomyces koelreuteriae TaxID=2838015 RepID=A0ABX8FQY0_9ACTN|nr:MULTISPECIES: LAETG motif-containing sortase-dependent surface protein [Streptomyces]QWB23575.1 LPXTG cell wall anchor domain-containing protein [Streptomyces koelreuteriae]UUA06533.1 LPXTG cell wall anchor domain-containing protein [Streptomyces koelreuteriae]UUA14162.1 LPXTG cell wall anchor domain-containing protein [Streptomyces sp. CRCS-T-1]